jgi:hypothetical protein
MSLKTTAIAKCTHCGNEQRIEIYNSINIEEDPNLKEDVRNGSLFVWECSSCGTMNLARHQTLYVDKAEKLIIWLLPEDRMTDAEKTATARQMKAVESQLDSEELAGFVLRRVDDVSSLIEKVNIHEAGLDDMILEMCKYVTRQELNIDVLMRFYRISGADSDIEFSYPQDGKMVGCKIGLNVYEDCKKILERNPDVCSSKGFMKIDAAWLSSFMK